VRRPVLTLDLSKAFLGFIENKTGAAEIKVKFLSPTHTRKTNSKRRTFWKKGETSFCVSGFVVSLAHVDVKACRNLARMGEILVEIFGETSVLSRAV
jgi:hypothetical protein